MATSTIKMPEKFTPVDVSSHATISSAWTATSKKLIKLGSTVFFTVSGYTTSYVANNTYHMVTLDSTLKPKNSPVFLGVRTDGNYNVQGFHSVHVNASQSSIDVSASSTQGSYWFISGWFEV